MSETLIEVQNVSKKFCRDLKKSLWYGVKDLFREMTGQGGIGRTALRKKEFLAVDDVSFAVNRGECLALIGPNGAGKSTLLKMINGLIKLDRGHIKVCGRVSALIELGAGFNPILTGRENIYINAAVLGIPKRKVDKQLDQIIEFADIGDFIDTPVQSYSSGMKVRLGFAVAAQLKPDVLIIDEVLAVGDTGFRLKCFNKVQEMVNKGVAAIVVSHNMNNITRIANQGIALHRGSIAYKGGIDGAVRAYENLLHEASAQSNSMNFIASETQLLRIKRVETLRRDGTQSRTFKCYEDIAVHIHYVSHVELENSTLIIKVSSPSLGDISSFTNHVLGQKIPIRIGEGYVDVILKEVPFLSGVYIIKAHFYDDTHNTFFDRDQFACAFEIETPEQDVWSEFHTVRLKHEWGSVCHAMEI